jgi:hypothetical protein
MASRDHSLMVRVVKRIWRSSSMRLPWHPFTLQNAACTHLYSGRAWPARRPPAEGSSCSTRSRSGCPLGASTRTQAEVREHLPVGLGEGRAALNADAVALCLQRHLRSQSSCNNGHCPLIRCITPSSPISLKPASHNNYPYAGATGAAACPSLFPWRPAAPAWLILTKEGRTQLEALQVVPWRRTDDARASDADGVGGCVRLQIPAWKEMNIF